MKQCRTYTTLYCSFNASSDKLCFPLAKEILTPSHFFSIFLFSMFSFLSVLSSFQSWTIRFSGLLIFCFFHLSTIHTRTCMTLLIQNSVLEFQICRGRFFGDFTSFISFCRSFNYFDTFVYLLCNYLIPLCFCSVTIYYIYVFVL